MVRSRVCWAKAVSLSKVMDLRRAGLIRPNTASMTDMVSAAVFPVSLAASVTRDLRSWRTSPKDPRLNGEDSRSFSQRFVARRHLRPGANYVFMEEARRLAEKYGSVLSKKAKHKSKRAYVQTECQRYSLST